MFRLNTVRAKLTLLVALSALATLATLPVLSWMMNRQLVDQVGDRVPQAIRTFRLELRNTLRTVSMEAERISRTGPTVNALREHDSAAAGAVLDPFHKAHPELGVALYDKEGALLAQRGFKAPPARTSEIAGLREGLAKLKDNERYRGMLSHGCEPSITNNPPSYLVGYQARAGTGAILVCLPIDEDYFAKAAEKLGVEIALMGPDGAALSGTKRFPLGMLSSIRDSEKPEIGDSGGSLWALSRYTPRSLKGDDSGGDFAIAVALDVSDIRAIVRRNLWTAVGVLSVVAVISMILGARLASIMSRALSRVNVALKKLESQQYVHVDAVRTGDELEDLATGFNAMVDGLRERDKLRTTFGKYMTRSVLDHLMGGKIQLGGETLQVSILFSDIRSFTSLSETMNAQELVALLNEYLTEMVTVIIEEDGVVDKYIGDAIMAVFGAPVPKPDDAERAVRAAVRMRVALSNLNERLAARGIAPLRTGIGIHSGEVVAGNIGSEARMEYTVIGDAVNLASRLESNTKELGVDVLISEDTLRLIGEGFTTRPVGEITVKGRAQPVMTYEVQG